MFDNPFLLIGGILVALYLIAVAATVAFYRRSSQYLTFVRTGLGGEKVVLDTGALVLPVLHDIVPVNMQTLRVEIARYDKMALITKDRLRVNVVVQFYLRVQQTQEAVAIAARTLGKRTLDPNSIKDLVEAQCVAALRSVVATMTLDELHEKRTDFEHNIEETVNEQFRPNGMELVSVSLMRLEQTAHEHFDENNAAGQQSTNSENSVQRVIEFKSDQVQAGLSILNYFSRILQQKYPGADVDVKITQKSNIVSMEISTSNGEIEVIEKILDEYGLVVTGKKQPEEFLSNPSDIMELKNKLEISAMELRMTKELHSNVNSVQEKRIESLESQVMQLHELIGYGVQQSNELSELLKLKIKAESKESHIEKAVAVLVESIASGVFEESNHTVQEAIEVLAKDEPTLLKEITDVLKGTVSGAVGGTVANVTSSSWLVPLINALPK